MNTTVTELKKSLDSFRISLNQAEESANSKRVRNFSVRGAKR